MGIGARADAELARAGQFSRLFPAAETVEDYLSFFPVPRYADIVLAQHVLGRKPKPLKLSPAQTTEIISDDELVLYYEKTGTLFKPSELSGWIWLKAADGTSPNNIAEELLAVHSASHGEPNAQERWQIYENVWNVLAEWAQIGMLQQANEVDTETKFTNENAINIATRGKVYAGNRVVELEYGTPILRQTLEPLFRKAPAASKPDVVLNLQRTDNGYAIALSSKLVASNVGLDKIGEVVSYELFKQSVTETDDIALAGTWIPVAKGQADFFLTPSEGETDSSVSFLYAAEQKKEISGGAILNLQTGALTPIGLPIRIDDTSTETAETLKQLTTSGIVQNRRVGGRGRLMPSTYKDDSQGYSLRRLHLESQMIDGEKAKSSSETASHHDALAALLASVIGENGEAPTGTQVQKMNDWLSDVEARTIMGSDRMATAKLLIS